MTIGQVPIRERLVLPRRQGVPLAHVFTGDEFFPGSTTASLYLYDVEDAELVFWPLTISGSEATLDVDATEWWPYRSSARSFTVFVVYSDAPGKKWPWYEGSIVRLP